MTDEVQLRSLVDALGHEVYGDDFEKFLITPRRSVNWETPTALLERGDAAAVLEVLIKVSEGDFG